MDYEVPKVIREYCKTELSDLQRYNFWLYSALSFVKKVNSKTSFCTAGFECALYRSELFLNFILHETRTASESFWLTSIVILTTFPTYKKFFHCVNSALGTPSVLVLPNRLLWEVLFFPQTSYNRWTGPDTVCSLRIDWRIYSKVGLRICLNSFSSSRIV